MLYRLDSIATDPYVSLTNAEILWDTGAHSTVVVDELLLEKFKDYLSFLAILKNKQLQQNIRGILSLIKPWTTVQDSSSISSNGSI